MRKCELCAHRQDDRCNLHNAIINPEQDTCPWWVHSLEICACCNTYIMDQLFIEGDKTLCARCNALSGTCARCLHGNQCARQEDRTMPDYVMHKVRQQNGMTIELQIPNPEKIAKYCNESCPCFNPEFGCLKQNGTCGHYELRVPG